MALARDEELAGLSRARFKKKFTVLDLGSELFATDEAILLALTSLTAKGGKNG